MTVVMATSSRRMMVGMVVMGMVLVVASQSVKDVTLLVGSMKVQPYLMEVNDNATGVTKYEGYIMDILERLSERMNFSYQIQLDTEFGRSDPAGRWNGLVGQLVDRRVHMVAAPLTVTSTRARDIDFSVPLQYLRGVIVLKRPPGSQEPQMSFLERARFLFLPLEAAVWLMAVVAYFLTSVILYVICYVSPYEWRHLCTDRQATRREAESFTCPNTAWFLLSTWMWQGFIRTPRSLGGRLVVAVWWAFVVVFLLTYTASLTNLLRVGHLPDQVRPARILGLRDLAEDSNSHVNIGLLKDGTTMHLLQSSRDLHMKALRRRMIEKPENFVKSVEEGIERVRASYVNSTPPFAFLTESTLVQRLVHQDPNCELYMVPSDMSGMASSYYSLAFHAGSSLAEKVDVDLLWLGENGILRALERRWFSPGSCDAQALETDVYEAAQEPPFYAVNMGSLSGIMIILAAGAVAGIIVTGLEVIIFRISEKIPDSDQPTGSEKTEGKGKGDNAAGSGDGTRSVSAV